MTKNGKILLGCGGLALLTVVVVLVVGYFALGFIEKRLDASSKPDQEAGTAYGQTADQAGCMTEGLKRAKGFGFLSMGEGISLEVFTEYCLKAAKPTAEFCTGVPGFWDLNVSEWKKAECRKKGMDEVKTACTYVFNAKHNVCSPPK